MNQFNQMNAWRDMLRSINLGWPLCFAREYKVADDTNWTLLFVINMPEGPTYVFGQNPYESLAGRGPHPVPVVSVAKAHALLL